MDVARLAASLALLVGSIGCAHRGHDQQSPSTSSAATTDALASIERVSTRSRIIADGIQLRATLWTPDLARATAATIVGSSKSRADVERRFTKRYTSGPSFTVVIDVARRRPDPARGETPVADPSHWHFGLGSAFAAPELVELVAIDRFPTEAGGHHERLVFEAHFANSRSEDMLELVVRCDAPAGRRYALGRFVAQRGVELTWSLTEVQAKIRTSDHLGV